MLRFLNNAIRLLHLRDVSFGRLNASTRFPSWQWIRHFLTILVFDSFSSTDSGRASARPTKKPKYKKIKIFLKCPRHSCFCAGESRRDAWQVKVHQFEFARACVTTDSWSWIGRCMERWYPARCIPISARWTTGLPLDVSNKMLSEFAAGYCSIDAII